MIVVGHNSIGSEQLLYAVNHIKISVINICNNWYTTFNIDAAHIAAVHETK